MCEFCGSGPECGVCGRLDARLIMGCTVVKYPPDTGGLTGYVAVRGDYRDDPAGFRRAVQSGELGGPVRVKAGFRA